MEIEIIIPIISLVTSLLSITYTFIAFKKTEKEDLKQEGKNEGIILSDIGYIKGCVERVEKNFYLMDEKYQVMVERISKVEEGLDITKKQVESLIIVKGGWWNEFKWINNNCDN